MSNDDGASEQARRDLLLATAGEAEHLLDLKEHARLEVVAKGSEFYKGDVQHALLGDDHLELRRDYNEG